MAELIARYKPGVNVPAFAKTAVLAGRFVKIVDDLTAQGDYQVGHAGAGDPALGVAEADSAATTEAATSVERRINVARRGSVARVTAGAAITAGALVQSDANGKAITYDPPALSGNAEDLPSGPVILGVACNTVAADGDVVDVDLI